MVLTKRVNLKISHHELSLLHIRSFSQWKELEIRIGQGATFDKLQQQNIDKEIRKKMKAKTHNT